MCSIVPFQCPKNKTHLAPRMSEKMHGPTEEYFYDFGVKKKKILAIKEKINKFSYIKIKNFCLPNNTIKQVEKTKPQRGSL